MPGQVGPAGGAIEEEGGGGSTTVTEIPTGAVNGVNTQFVFVGVPVEVLRNGVAYSPDAYSVEGTTVTIPDPPPDGQITGVTTVS